MFRTVYCIVLHCSALYCAHYRDVCVQVVWRQYGGPGRVLHRARGGGHGGGAPGPPVTHVQQEAQGLGHQHLQVRSGLESKWVNAEPNIPRRRL